MKRQIITTRDGSSSVFLPDWEESYHSKHGAVRESRHVFLQMGLRYLLENQNPPRPVRILEIGFGTGLNTLLTFLETQEEELPIEYTAVEAYPLPLSDLEKLNYTEQLAGPVRTAFKKIHALTWEKMVPVFACFRLKKEQRFFQEIDEKDAFHCVYFDAFSPQVQPELWTEELFLKMYHALKKGGVLTTYSAKGSVRRTMQTVGFKVEKLPGPPGGKREMLRAVKI